MAETSQSLSVDIGDAKINRKNQFLVRQITFKNRDKEITVFDVRCV